MNATNFLVTIAILLILWLWREVNQTKHQIRMNAAELKNRIDSLSTQVGNVSDQLTKATVEITNEIQTLKDAASNEDLDAVATSVEALEAKVAALAPLAKQLDDLNPDAAPAPATEPTPEQPPTSES